MAVPARLFGPDREEITDSASWLDHAPPERGDAQWRDGWSAKELAKAWTASGSPAMPDEVAAALPAADEIYGRPEHRTKLDDLGRERQHDLLACLRRDGGTVYVAGIEAKACEPFGGPVRDRASAEPPGRERQRCNLLARALFGRPVFDEETGAILDDALANHGYQLWTAAVGTILEAQRRDLERCALVVHQFRPADLEAARAAGDTRDWERTLAANAAAFETFAAAVREAGSVSHATPFVAAGTALDVVKVESTLPA